jgi:hypothetical protein
LATSSFSIERIARDVSPLRRCGKPPAPAAVDPDPDPDPDPDSDTDTDTDTDTDSDWVQIHPGLKMIVGTEQVGVACAT